MNRRNFIKLCAGAAVAVASGMELFKKDIKPWHPSDWGWDPQQYMGELRFIGWDVSKDYSSAVLVTGEWAGGEYRVRKLRSLYANEPPYDVEELKKASPPWHPRAYRMSDVGLHPRQLKSLG
jgi:hypothetical protein